MAVEEQRATGRRAAASPIEEAPSVDVASVEAAVHPMDDLRGWATDLAALGSAFGAPLGVFLGMDTGQPLMSLAAVLTFSVLGAIAGVMSGGMLRWLRGRVPAALGLLFAILVGAGPFWLGLAEEGANVAIYLTWVPLWTFCLGFGLVSSVVGRANGGSTRTLALLGLLGGLCSVALRVAFL
jgi:hypothetical protein